MSDNTPLLHTPQEAAEQIRCSRTTVYALMASGALTSIRIGSLRRIPHDELVRYIDALREPQPTSAVEAALR